MFAIFIEGANDEIDYSRVYALCFSEPELEEELLYCEEHGVAFDWREI